MPGDFERARGETIRYHEELYATTSLGQKGTWLEKPHRLLADALALVPADRPLIAYDLGAGVGRHTLPMLALLPPGSEVYAVDLLSSALARLQRAAPPGTAARLHTRQADLSDYTFGPPADLVFAFSAIEHIGGLRSIRALLERARRATRPGAVVAFGVVADRSETDCHGNHRPALIESSLSARAACDLLDGCFSGFDVDYRHFDPAKIREERKTERYTLDSVLLTWLAHKTAC